MAWAKNDDEDDDDDDEDDDDDAAADDDDDDGDDDDDEEEEGCSSLPHYLFLSGSRDCHGPWSFLIALCHLNTFIFRGNQKWKKPVVWSSYAGRIWFHSAYFLTDVFVL